MGHHLVVVANMTGRPWMSQLCSSRNRDVRRMGCGASNALDAWGLGRSSMGGKWFSTLLGAIHGDVRKQL